MYYINRYDVDLDNDYSVNDRVPIKISIDLLNKEHIKFKTFIEELNEKVAGHTICVSGSLDTNIEIINEYATNHTTKFNENLNANLDIKSNINNDANSDDICINIII